MKYLKKRKRKRIDKYKKFKGKIRVRREDNEKILVRKSLI